MWVESYITDPEVRLLADDHYFRKTPKTRMFLSGGRMLVLKVPGDTEEPYEVWTTKKFEDGRRDYDKCVESGTCIRAKAAWATHFPFADFVQHEWRGAWINQFFRNEGAGRASDLIKEAVVYTALAGVGKVHEEYDQIGADEPVLIPGTHVPRKGMVTMIDPKQTTQVKVRGEPVVGWTYRQAGFKEVGLTGTGKVVFQIRPAGIDKLVQEFGFDSILPADYDPDEPEPYFIRALSIQEGGKGE